MISWMQKNRKYLVVTIWVSTIAFIGSGAVGWGAYKYGGIGSDSVAKVGDIEIKNSELNIATNNIFNYYNNMFGGKLTKAQAQKMHIQEQALSQLESEALLLNYAKDLGITALDSEIIKEYSSIKAFWVDGKFSKSRLTQILRAQGVSKKDFENEIKKSVILKKLKEALNLPVTDLEKESLFAGKDLLQDIEIKSIDIDDNSIDIKEKELKDFWQKNKNRYLSKLNYKIDAIFTKSSDLKIDDKELKDFYTKNRLKFKKEDGKIKSFDEAKDEVIKEYRLKNSRKNALKNYLALKKGEIKPQKEIDIFEDNKSVDFTKLKTLKSGEYIKALKFNDEWISGKISQINKPSALPFEQAKEYAKKDLILKKEKELLQTKANKALKSDLKDMKDLGYLSIADGSKIKDLSPLVAQKLLQKVFTTNSKKGYIVSGRSAIIFNVINQKLFDENSFKTESDKLTKNVKALKKDMIQTGLKRFLKTKYDIKQFVKFTNKKEG